MGSRNNNPVFENTSAELFGRNFRMLRKHRGLSIAHVSKAINVSEYRLKKLEAGTLKITASLLVIVCDFFDVLIDCMVRQDLSKEQ